MWQISTTISVLIVGAPLRLEVLTTTSTTILWLSGFWRDNPGEPVPEETCTHYCSHQSSLICFLHLLRFMASSLFNLHAWQAFYTISLQVFSGLPLGLVPSIHFFTQSLSSFHSTCPYHRNHFCCSTKIISSNRSLPLNSLCATVSFTLSPHIHLIIIISAQWSATSFSFLRARSHFHATYYFAHNCCTNSLSVIQQLFYGPVDFVQDHPADLVQER